MYLFRLSLLSVIGLGFVALLARLTSWPFAFYCYGALSAALATHQARSATPFDVPLWMSGSRGQLFLYLMAIFSICSPPLLGIIWFQWWWGFAGWVLGGIGAAMSPPSSPIALRLIGGLILCVGAATFLLPPLLPFR